MTPAALLLVWLALLSAQTPLHRSRSLIVEFARTTGFPNGRPGWVVDHTVPLCAGGPDRLDNLRWQKKNASFRKDVFERQLCKDMQKLKLKMVQE